MRVVIAPDAFKEAASAAAVAAALARGWKRVFPDSILECVPMADGGEGTMDALVAATGGHATELDVTGPLGEPLRAAYGMLGDGATAVIEMAAASGLPLVPAQRRDPGITTTRGTGELMRHAITAGARRLIIGIGGSATNDGGAGMATALGYVLRGADGQPLLDGGMALAGLECIDVSGVLPELEECEILVACDVANPLCGPDGASHVYGPQKGADAPMVERLDAALRRFGEVVEAQLGISVLEVAGAGAAGGLGAGLIAFARAQLRPGVELVAEACGLERRIKGADLVITGEGRLDKQSAYGKTPVGVARLAKAHNVPVVAVAGALGPGYEEVYACGIDAAYAICPGPMSLDEALGQTEARLEAVAETIARTWRALA